MRFLQNLPIKSKLTFITMVTSCVALLLGCVAFAIYEQNSFKHTMVQDFAIIADMFDDAVAPGLAFNDPSAIRKVLGAMDAHPRIMASCVYDRSGKIVAKYFRAGVGADFVFPPPAGTSQQFTEMRLDTFKEVPLAGEIIGVIYIGADLEEITDRGRRYAVTVCVLLLACSLVAYLMASRLQKFISQPVLDLGRTAAAVAANRDYSLRAVKHNDDEIGRLIDGFNEMLSQIQKRDGDLQQAHNLLEQRVDERTRQLKAEVTERARVADALAISEGFLHSLVDNLPVNIYRKDREGRFTFANQRFCARKQLTLEKILGRTDFDFSSRETAEKFRQSDRAVLESGRVYDAIEEQILTDGTTRYIQILKVPITDGNGQMTGTQGMYLDVTEQRKAQNAVAEQAHLAVLRADVGLALTQKDLLPAILRNCAEALVRHLDAAFARIWILNPSSQVLELGASAGQYTHLDGPHSRVPVGQFKIGLIAQERQPHLTNCVVGDPRVGDQEWAKREGMVAFAGYPLIVGENVVGVVAMFARHALSENTLQSLASVADSIGLGIVRKQTETRLREKDEFLNSILQNLPIMVFAKEAHELRNVLWNKANEELYGYTSAEVAGKCDHDLFPPADADFYQSKDREVLRSGKLLELEKDVTTRHKGIRTLHIRKIPILDERGQPLYLLGIAEDITEQKRAELELKKAHHDLVETSRMAGMAEVATGVLHNVGNVLNSINVSTTLVADTLKQSKAANLGRVTALLSQHPDDLGAYLANDPKGRQIGPYLAQLSEHLIDEQAGLLKEVEAVRKNIDHIKDIVAMQQNYAKVSGVTDTVEVTDLVEDALSMNAGALLRHEVQLFREFETGLPLITVEKHKVLQILVNLIRNAKYACDDSGRKDKRLIVKVTNGADRLRIAVIDNGIGIPPGNLTRIFNHGFTTREKGHGFGLHSGALAARELGGALLVHSDGNGLGATFTLELPLTPRQDSP